MRKSGNPPREPVKGLLLRAGTDSLKSLLLAELRTNRP
jgi:hypothetical protein